MAGKSILFIMDPPEKISIDRDTTFAFMLEAQARGYTLAHTRREWVWHEGGVTGARWQPARVERRAPPEHIHLGEMQDGPIQDHVVCFVRTDPPFDMRYVELTWMLDVVDPASTLVINAPRGIRSASEKLYTLHFPELTPPTLISRDIARIERFLEAQGGKIVVKPVDLMGGYGVFVVRADDPNRRALLEVSTEDGRRLCVAQGYIPQAPEGDKRVLLVDGEPLGAILRVPPEGEHRGNIHVGAATVPSPIDEHDRRICAALAPRLKQDGIVFAGIDVIGGKLTEVNVTSPTGVQEVKNLCDIDVSAALFDWIERQ
ncbi:MAG: glutathione synthase [Deltaproteobacteria bacterium]|nr:glutathione synthase [Deltaproteobacteria bacterium]